MGQEIAFDYLIIVGPIIHALSFGNLELKEKCGIKVDVSSGRIVQMTDDVESLKDGASSYRLIELKAGQFLCPGFIDTHHHAPQTANLGLGLDRELLQWLEKYTFPRETSYGTRSADSIAQEYTEMAARLLRGGTTTCMYFGSLQLGANQILVDVLEASGQRAFIGKVCMDQNSPSSYCESSEESVKGTEAFINYIESKSNELLEPVVTPRFAPTCSMESMKQLGNLAREHNSHIQTHVSENLSEIDWVRSLFPNQSSYCEVYDEAALLTPKTMLAHAIHLSDDEKSLIKARGSAVSHCPNSNFALNSGVLNVRDLLERGIKVALGTDVSGGYSTSMLDACRQAIIASKVIHFQDRQQFKPLTAAESFSLATLNGAISLNLENDLGNFVEGKLFDALIVDVFACPQIPRSGLLEAESLANLFEKFLFCGDDRCISSVFVNGKQIK